MWASLDEPAASLNLATGARLGTQLRGWRGQRTARLREAPFSSVHPTPEELSAQGHIWGAVDAPFAVMDNQLVELVDLNGDGLPDVLKTESGAGAHTVSINRGPVQQAGNWAIQWGAPVTVDPGIGTAWNFDLASGQTHLADMDGDGLADLVHKSSDGSVFFFASNAVTILVWVHIAVHAAFISGWVYTLSHVVYVPPPSPPSEWTTSTSSLALIKLLCKHESGEGVLVASPTSLLPAGS